MLWLVIASVTSGLCAISSTRCQRSSLSRRRSTTSSSRRLSTTRPDQALHGLALERRLRHPVDLGALEEPGHGRLDDAVRQQAIRQAPPHLRRVDALDQSLERIAGEDDGGNPLDDGVAHDIPTRRLDQRSRESHRG